MDFQVAKRLSWLKLSQPLSTSSLDGRLMCKVTHQTSPVMLVFDDSHQEKVNFLLLKSVPLPWVLKHNPYIDWSTGSAYEWRRNCVEHCFLDRKSPQETVSEEAEKFDLYESPVSLMGCIVSNGQVGMDQRKLQAIIEWPLTGYVYLYEYKIAFVFLWAFVWALKSNEPLNHHPPNISPTKYEFSPIMLSSSDSWVMYCMQIKLWFH